MFNKIWKYLKTIMEPHEIILNIVAFAIIIVVTILGIIYFPRVMENINDKTYGSEPYETCNIPPIDNEKYDNWSL